MTTSTEPALSHSRSLRLWPAWVLVVLGIVLTTTFYILGGDDRPRSAMAIFMGAPATGLALLLWWMGASGIAWKQRWIGLGFFLLGLGVTIVAAEHKMRLVIVMFGITLFLLLALGWLTLSRNWSKGSRQWGVIAIGVVVMVTSCYFRLKGMTGNMIPDLAPRWSKTSEEVAAEYRAQQQEKAQAKEMPLQVGPGDWPEFRGPKRNGIVPYETIRTDWVKHPPKLVWKHPIGLGWSSFALVDGHLYTQAQRLDQEAIICFDAETGKEIWSHGVPTRFVEAAGGDGPRATPTFHEGRIYALGATGILSCLDAKTGEKIWSKDILSENGATNPHWGMAGSPLVYKDLVIVNPGGPNGNALVAYDRITGKKVWGGGGDEAGYSSPHLAVLQGMEQILIFHTGGLSGHDPANGKELWKFPWPRKTTNNSIQPWVLDDSTILISSVLIGTARLKVTRDGDQWQVKQEWMSSRMKLYFNDMVVKNGYAYALDSGIPVCFDVKTGKRKWKQGRYRSGQGLLINLQDLFLVLTEGGDLLLLRAQPNGFEKVAQHPVLEGKTWNHPVLAHGRVYVRNGEEIACYDLSPVEKE